MSSAQANWSKKRKPSTKMGSLRKKSSTTNRMKTR